VAQIDGQPVLFGGPASPGDFLSWNGSDWTNSSLLTVPNGGTGLASLSPWDVLVGGTTGTGPVQQVSGEGTLGQVLTSQGAAALPVWAAGGVVIGNPVGGGSAGEALYVDGSGNLAQAAGLLLNAATPLITLGWPLTSTATGTFTAGSLVADLVPGPAAFSCTDGTNTMRACNGSQAVYTTDGTHNAALSDGSFSVVAYTGPIYTTGTVGNTYMWGNAAPTPTPQPVLGAPLSAFGSGAITDFLGTPDAWIYVAISGATYRVPAYL